MYIKQKREVNEIKQKMIIYLSNIDKSYLFKNYLQKMYLFIFIYRRFVRENQWIRINIRFFFQVHILYSFSWRSFPSRHSVCIVYYVSFMFFSNEYCLNW
jgi:hypothetical protein